MADAKQHTKESMAASAEAAGCCAAFSTMMRIAAIAAGLNGS